MLGRYVLSNVMFRFYRWRWRWWFRSKEKDWIQSPQQHSCSYQQCSTKYPSNRFLTSDNPMKSAAFGAEVKPQQRKWTVWRYEQIGNVNNRLGCIVYVCSGFMLVFSRLTKKTDLRSHCFSVYGDILLCAYKVHTCTDTEALYRPYGP